MSYAPLADLHKYHQRDFNHQSNPDSYTELLLVDHPNYEIIHTATCTG